MIKTTLRSLSLVAVILGAGQGFAQTTPDIRENQDIFDRLLHIAVADEIRKECDSISPRLLRALLYLNGTKSLARDLGYTNGEVTDFVEDEVQIERLRQAQKAYVSAGGALYNDPTSFCALGEAEISQASPIGRMLRSR